MHYMQKQKSDQSEWQQTASFVRHHTEDGVGEAIIKNVDIQDSTAYLTLSPESLDDTFTCEIDASLNTENISPFEKFLSKQGYEPTENDLFQRLEGDKCEVRVNNREEIDLTPIVEEETEQKDENQIKNRLFSMGFGYLIGSIPIINILILYVLHREVINFRNESEYTADLFAFTVGLSTTTVIIYPILILYL